MSDPTCNKTTATMTITANDLLRIYEAGIERGNEEAVAADWNNHPCGDKLDALEHVLVWGYPPILSGEPDERKAAWAKIMEAMNVPV